MYLTSLSQGDQEGCRGRLENASNATDAEKGRVTRAEATISFLEAASAVVAGEEHSFSAVVVVVELTCWDNGRAGARARARARARATEAGLVHAVGTKAWDGTSNSRSSSAGGRGRSISADMARGCEV